MSKICGDCVFFPGCSRYEGKTHDSEAAETCRAYLWVARRGQWLVEEEEDGSDVSSFRPVRADEGVSWNNVVCSECRSAAQEDSEWGTVFLTRFCPHCGAEMDNWQSEEQQAANNERQDDEEAERSRAEIAARVAAMTPGEREIYEQIWAVMRSTGPVDPATFEDPHDEPEGVTPDIVITELFGG